MPNQKLLLNQKGIVDYNLNLTNKARLNRLNSTRAENFIWQKILRNCQTGYKFLRQKPIGNFILDFYCSKLLLGIEIDGDSHAEQKEYDQKRTNRLKQLGIKIIRYNNTEVMNNLESLYLDLIKQLQERENELNSRR